MSSVCSSTYGSDLRPRSHIHSAKLSNSSVRKSHSLVRKRFRGKGPRTVPAYGREGTIVCVYLVERKELYDIETGAYQMLPSSAVVDVQNLIVN